MLMIRFNRVGRKNHAQYRLVVQEKTAAPAGKHIAVVGSYDPHSKEAVLKTEALKTYISNGAQPSDSVYNLLVREGVIEGEKRFVKVPEKKVEEKEEETAEETTDAKDEDDAKEAGTGEETTQKEDEVSALDAEKEPSAEKKSAATTDTQKEKKEDVQDDVAPKASEDEKPTKDKEESAGTEEAKK